MIITVGNTKGGVGKTTIAVNLAIARALAGRDVWLIDGDRQGTAQTAISIRAEAGHTPGIACATYPDGPTLRAQVQQQAAKFDDVVIDAGGRDSTALRAALVLSDVLLVPFQPRSYDVWALNDIAALVDEARSVRDGLRCFAVLNCADPASTPPTTPRPPPPWPRCPSSSICRPRYAAARRFPTPQGRVCLKSSRKTAKQARNLMHLSAHCFNIKSICFKCGDRFNGDYKETDEARARRYRSGGGCLHFRCAGCCRSHRKLRAGCARVARCKSR
jgi:hypothetical protein